MLKHVNLHSLIKGFPIQLGFAMTVKKAQGKTLECVIVALSERNMTLTNFHYSCLYVAMSCVREARHLRIILSNFQNRDDEWQSLHYLQHLKRDDSIKHSSPASTQTEPSGQQISGILNEHLKITAIRIINIIS